jgi:hypothetical protein
MLVPLDKRQVAYSLEMLRAARYRYALVHDALFKTKRKARLANARMEKIFGKPIKTVEGIRQYALRPRAGK